MTTLPPAHALPVSLDQIEHWLDGGFYLQVHPHVEALLAGDARAVSLAGRALRSLGAERAGELLALRLGRRQRGDAQAVIGLIRTCIYRRGPYAGWQALARYPLPAQAPLAERAEYLSLRAFLLSLLRDFSAARVLSTQARELNPQDPWLWVEWAYCCEREDRYDEALAACDEALALFPGFRAAQQKRAALLMLCQREEEALALLDAAFAGSECAGLGMQLFDLCFERGEHARCAGLIERISALLPRADKWTLSSLAARRADLALAAGDLARARSEAEAVQGSVFYRHIGERIAQGMSPQRVMLPVGFVRQHWNTCAPATLAALSAYWGRAADHLEIAEKICYDGTADHSERSWAADNGFIAREFRVDWPTACALLDAGIPFTLATVYTAGGHLQAVIGYDALRASLLIRDPFQPTHAEFDAEALFAQHASSGPRGMILLPPEEAGRLAGISLPDADEWDLYHRLLSALDGHDRAAASAAQAQLQASAPGHRLTLQGARVLAMYDGDEPEILRGTDALLERFPDDVNLQLSRGASLWAIGGRAAHIEWLAQLATRPGADPLILMRYADRLAEDGRRQQQAMGIIRSALRRAGGNGRLWSQWAVLTWQAGDTRAALPLYRHAATLIDTDEDYAACYFRACHYLGDTETGLALLRERCERLGRKAAAPLLTLFEQLDNLARSDEAFAVLDQALAWHPEDAALRTYCAEVWLRNGDLARAGQLLEAISSPVRRANWLRAQALLLDARGETAAALDHAREASALEPLNLRHHRHVADLLSRHESRAVAVAWLADACRQHPRHYALNRLYYDWLPDEAETIERQLRHMADTHPGDVWVMRELATQLTRGGRYDEALQLARAAVARAPRQAETHGVLAFVLLRQHGYGAALPHLQQAVQLSIDYDYAFNVLIDSAPDEAQARAAIDLVRGELQRQVTTGDSLLNFQECARRHLPADEVLAVMREAHAARPDLWHAWAALGIQLTSMGRPAEALPVFEEALGRFSMLPRLFVEAAEALKLLGQREAARERLQRALALSPAWNRAVHLYVDIAAEEGQGWEEAEQVLRHALSREPQNADLRALQGWLLEQRGEHGAAFEAISASLKLDPRPRWVWASAQRLCEARQCMADFEALLQEVEQSRAGDPWAWMVRARHDADDAAALAAAERAISLDPRLIAAWEARCERLLKLGRGEGIAALLAEAGWPDGILPIELQLWQLRARREQDKAGAVSALQALLADAPMHYAGWCLLADWADADEDHPGYIAAAQAMQRIAPTAAQAQVYLGHALIKAGRHDEALAPLRSALTIEPGYAFAAWQLSVAALEGSEPAAAIEAAEILWPHRPRADLAARATRGACRAGLQEEAERWFLRTLELAGNDKEPVEEALQAMTKAGWQAQLGPLTERAIRAGQCAWEAASLWLRAQRKQYAPRPLLARLDGLIREEAGVVLKMVLLDEAGTQRDRALLDCLLRDYHPLLRAHDSTWGMGSYALQRLDENREVLRWMGDWRDRPDAPVWALGNLALAHASLGDFEAAAGVAAQVLARRPDDQDARLWQLVAHAAGGRHAELADGLQRLAEWQREDWMEPVMSLLHAYHEAVSARRFFAAIRVFRRIAPDKPGLIPLHHLARRLGRHLAWRVAPLWAAPFLWLALDGG